ncbi:mitotic spindle checkpoint protein BUBR1-like [Cynara cardunculus var. scolymus]|uniref:mitotic spindle checkpoint protein BUBR1-like n=1 Tax=Cynara cardunculus var. scolymus TaxID=59895 RepID=UPI000D630489|nr:mitotic spindle checkpoint protein BUBR1-like [Cynara cardunculus var. scolymus]
MDLQIPISSAMEEIVEHSAATTMDPETEFLASKQQTGNEWELFKENVRPLKRGRNVKLLNHSLKSHSDIHVKDSLLDTRRNLIRAIDEYEGEDPLHPWLDCIKWVQDAFPPGGDGSGLVVIYEQCVRSFWHEERYKDDLRYLKVWLEYAESCADAEVVYKFLDTNKIGQTHSIFYISYALHLESNNKIVTANDIYDCGISRNAQPIEKLKSAYKKFFARSMNRPKATAEESLETHQPARSFGTVLARGGSGNQILEGSEISKKRSQQEGAIGAPLKVFKDTSTGSRSSMHQSESLKPDLKPWHTLGARAERNKENKAIPAKWTSNKIPQRPGHRIGAATTPCIEVFVDEESSEPHNMGSEGGRSSALQLKDKVGQELKKETELLRENPLRHFPPSSLR